MKKNGYSLIEYCVYLTCCMIVALIVSWCILDFLQFSRKHFKHTELYYCGALNVLAHDLLCAPQDRQNWHVVDDNQLIWKNRVQDVGWYLHNDKLWRVTGQYDKNTRTWTKQSRNLVAYHITHFIPHLITKKRNIIGVKIHVRGNDSAMVFYFPTMHGKQCFIS